MNSLIFDTVIGLVFFLAVFAFVVSGFAEGLSRFFGLRAEFLLRGVSSLLDTNTAFDKSWLPTVVQNAEDAQHTATREDLEAAVGESPAGEPAGAAIADALTAALAAVAAAEQDGAESKRVRELSGTAADRLDAARAALRQEQREIEALPPDDPDRPPRTARLHAARARLDLARRAHAHATGSTSAVTVATIMTQPVVNLTAALDVPRGAWATSMSRKAKRKLPSYLSSRTFSRALMRTLVPDPENGQTTIDQLQHAIDGVPNDQLKQVLRDHVDTANGKVTAFRDEVERWYDEHMDRVSGWYKRHSRRYVLGVAAVLAIGFNINAVAVAQAFYSDQALREAVVQVAFQYSDCQAGDEQGKDATTPAECLDDVRGQIDDVRGAGLPVGWAAVDACQTSDSDCSWWEKYGVLDAEHDGVKVQLLHILLLLIGWAIIAGSTLLGARFWFDLLSKLNTLRSAGRKPQAS